jgi:hypothetical protein
MSSSEDSMTAVRRVARRVGRVDMAKGYLEEKGCKEKGTNTSQTGEKNHTNVTGRWFADGAVAVSKRQSRKGCWSLGAPLC